MQTHAGRSDRGALQSPSSPRPAALDARRLSPSALLSLQRQAGNRATRRLARRVEIRGVPWEPESGISRLPELLERMNAISPSLTFSMDGDSLHYEQRPDPKPPNSFDLQMIDLIDRGDLLPVRLVNRQALIGDAANGYHLSVDGDAFQSGYVDIDDLLAGDDLGFQMLLLHFLTERAVTRNYAHRVGTNFPDAEFRHSHSLGVEAEAQVLREFFGDPTIVIWADSPSPTVRRVFFSRRRRDKFRRRIRLGHGADQGVNASTVDVVTHQGQVLTPEAYLELLRREH
ncbi:MAG TPA: hypothetical protein VFH80_18220 [Solirubrobacteraceae bacterium]|nr:hypothetical protein [Solirubrobacteraceae bacterium]